MYENEQVEVSDEEDSRYSPPAPSTPAPVLPPPLPARVRNVATTLASTNIHLVETKRDDPVFDLENEPDGDCEMSQQMTASYSEISFKSNQSTDSTEDVQPSLDLDKIDGGLVKEPARQRPATLACDRPHKGLGPLNLEGKVHVEGNITYFEAEDLEQKIKLSSPIAKKEDSPLPVYSRSGTPNKLYRQILAPQVIQVDSVLLHDLEIEAQRLATSIDGLTENLCGILHSISSITADNIDIYKDAVSKMSDAMDANIKSMYTILAKAEEVTKVMKSVQSHSVQIKEIKRLVDLFETYL